MLKITFFYVSILALAALTTWRAIPILLLLRGRWKKSRKPCDLPVINLQQGDYERARYWAITDLAGLLKQGREEHRLTGFQLWTVDGWLVILPEEYINEIKSQHYSVIDNHEPLTHEFIGDYNWFPLFKGNRVTPATIQQHCVNQMSNLIPAVIDEILYGFETSLPECKEWTPVPIFQTFLRIIALTAGRVWVGPDLNRDPEWLECGTHFTVDLAKAGWEMRRRGIVKKIWAHYTSSIPEVRKVFDWQNLARRRIIPIIKERQLAMAADPAYRPPEDFITWNMAESLKQDPPSSLEFQSRFQLELFLAAIHFNTMTITHILYDLLAHPSYIELLRAEVSSVWPAAGARGLTKPLLAKLPLLDSFLKESQRLSLPRLISLDRVVQSKSGFTFKSGLHLPYKTYFAFNSYGMSQDPAIYGDPEEFQGFRFAEMRRKSPENTNRWQYATTDPKASIAFGHGRHACTGRAFAGMEMKILVAQLLMEYDVLPAGDTKVRPQNVFRGPQVNVDVTGKMMLKKRHVTVDDGA